MFLTENLGPEFVESGLRTTGGINFLMEEHILSQDYEIDPSPNGPCKSAATMKLRWPIGLNFET